MSYKRMVNQEPKLAAEVASWLGQADAAKDTQYGANRPGNEMPG